MVKKTKKLAIDQLLVIKQEFRDIKSAKAAIMAGQVICNDQRIDKPKQLVDPSSTIRVKRKNKFVSRAGDKLHLALKKLNLSDYVQNKIIVDVGASSGGFTDCCLQLGAQKCYCIDVGTNQLDWSIRNNISVESLENTNFKDFNPGYVKEQIDLVLADISFTSLTYFVDSFSKLKKNENPVYFLLLVKPQFEIDSHLIPKGGIIEDAECRQSAVDKVIEAFKSKGFKVIKYIPSPLKGRLGNQEYFLYMQL